MKNQEILKKAIEKAMENGYNVEYIGNYCVEDFFIEGRCNYHDYDCFASRVDDVDSFSLSDFIFSHDFCKAFFGEEERVISDDHGIMSKWQWNLAEMVLEEDPIKYLAQYT